MPKSGVGRKVVDASEAAELLAEWADSGEAMSTWCGRRGINWYSLSAFKGWPGRRGADFVEVEVQPAPLVARPRAPSRYRVHLGCRVVEVDQDFDDEVLRRLVRVVEAC